MYIVKGIDNFWHGSWLWNTPDGEFFAYSKGWIYAVSCLNGLARNPYYSSCMHSARQSIILKWNWTFDLILIQVTIIFSTTIVDWNTRKERYDLPSLDKTNLRRLKQVQIAASVSALRSSISDGRRYIGRRSADSAMMQLPHQCYCIQSHALYSAFKTEWFPVYRHCVGEYYVNWSFKVLHDIQLSPKWCKRNSYWIWSKNTYT